MLAAYDIFRVSFATADTGGRLTGCDRGYRKLLGHTKESIAGLTAHDVTHPEDRADYLSLMNTVVRDGAPLIVRKRSLRRNGSVQWVQNRVTRFDAAETHLLIASRPIDPPGAPGRLEDTGFEDHPAALERFSRV